MAKYKGPLVAIIGETASGKSALALDVAKITNGEIICADSWTVYRDFNIGTAKPSADDRRLIKHHLLDIVDPHDGYSAAIFKKQAMDAIETISNQGKIPILVGGTGLYIDSVVFDYSFLPPPAAGIREELNKLSIRELLLKAAELSLNTENIDIRNKRRIIRLIENNGHEPTRNELRQNTLLIGIQVEREQLKDRITQRVDEMFDRGLEQEVTHLIAKYGWEVEPMKGIGYREFKNYYSGQTSIDEVRQQIIKSTLDLAKRQRTWFKRNKSIQWATDRSNAVETITTFLNK